LFFSDLEGLIRAVFTKLSRGTGYKVYGDLMAKMSRQLQVTRS